MVLRLVPLPISRLNFRAKHLAPVSKMRARGPRGRLSGLPSFPSKHGTHGTKYVVKKALKKKFQFLIFPFLKVPSLRG